MRGKIIVPIVILLFISGVTVTMAEDVIVTGEPVTVIDINQEPVVSPQIYEGLKGFVDENGDLLTISSEDIDILNSFTETTLIIDEPVQNTSYKQSFLPLGWVCFLPIKIIYSSGQTEQSGIFTSLLTDGMVTCVLPPANQWFRIGNNEFCTLEYSLTDLIKCQMPPVTGCCAVNFTLRLWWYPVGIPIRFCFNAPASGLCNILKFWFALFGGEEDRADWTEGGFCNYEIKECEPDTPTAIAIASFTATPSNKSVTLTWETGDETETFGFNIYRADNAEGIYGRINSSIIFAEAGAGTGAKYIYVDNDVYNSSTYYYKLEGVHNDGSSVMSKSASATPRLIYAIMK